MACVTWRTWIRLAAALPLCSMLACSSSSSPSADGGTAKAWTYPEHQFVINTLTLPTGPNEYTYDFNHDGHTPQNKIGALLAGFSSQFPPDRQPQVALEQTMKKGDIILLFAIYAKAMQDSAPSNIWAFLGEGLDLTDGPQPGGTFSVDTSHSPTNAYFGGTIASSKASFGGDDASLMLNLPILPGTNVNVTLRAVRTTFTVGSDGNSMQSGIVTGAIDQQELTENVLPEAARLLDAEVATCTARRDGGTVTADCGCPDGVKILVTLFDTDHNCVITESEVTNNPIVQSVLTPDVKLKTCPTSAACALSAGVAFTGVNATFTHIAPPTP